MKMVNSKKYLRQFLVSWIGNGPSNQPRDVHEVGTELLTVEERQRANLLKPQEVTLEVPPGWILLAPKRQNPACSKLVIVILIALFLTLIAILGVSFLRNSSSLSRKSRYVTTTTSCGPVEGVRDEHDVVTFFGIPYAQPPVGDLRWKATQPLESWEGTWKAHNNSRLCPQRSLPPPYYDSVTYDEDCLYLDIYTPRVSYDKPIPVVVYFAGDSFAGHNHIDILWRPTPALIQERDVVVVVVYYRMNSFGFMALKEFDQSPEPSSSGNYSQSAEQPASGKYSQSAGQPASGNFALYDMMTALQWVRTNINHFGGASQLITVLGHGSGGSAMLALLSTRKARHLFNQAWITGGSASIVNKTLAEVQSDNKLFAKNLDCSSIECLLKRSAAEIRSAELLTTSESEYWPGWSDGNFRELPDKIEKQSATIVIDGKLLYDLPEKMWDNGDFNDVALVVGSNAYSTGFSMFAPDIMDWDWVDLELEITERIGTINASLVEEVFKLYRKHELTPQLAFIKMVSDLRVTCPLQQLAKIAGRLFSNRVYSYVNQFMPDGEILHMAPHFNLPVHSLDVAAIFGRLEELLVQTSDRDIAFQSRVQDLFYGFVHSGSMLGDAEVKAPSYWLAIGDDVSANSFTYGQCELWYDSGLYPKYAKQN